MEQLNYKLLFRWFAGLSVDDPLSLHAGFSKNHDRLLKGDIAETFLLAGLNLAQVKGLLSDEHFPVDGILLKAGGSMSSFRRKDGQDEPPAAGHNGERKFWAEKQLTGTHTSTTDSDARLAKKSGGSPADARDCKGETASGAGDAWRVGGFGAEDGRHGQELRHRSRRCRVTRSQRRA